jgi:hypothetical protein
MSAKMTENSLYSPNFGEFLETYPKNVKEKIFDHPNNDKPENLIKAIIDSRAEKIGVKEKDFILAIYQCKIGNSMHLNYDEYCDFKESYAKHFNLPDIQTFKEAPLDDYILTSLKNFMGKELINKIYTAFIG